MDDLRNFQCTFAAVLICGFIAPWSPVRGQVVTVSPAAAHAAQLQKSALGLLRQSQGHLKRRAYQSARIDALDSLRSIVARHDAMDGGNLHSRQWQTALTALRESRDFSGQIGTLDPESIQRMVTVHQTDVLKHHDLCEMTSLRAMDAYLAMAKKQMLAATGLSPIASEALTVLGCIERERTDVPKELAIATAVIWQQAAVMTSPNNAAAHRELGVSLMYQGLAEPASKSLQRSLAIKPTRQGYQRLLELSSQLGDQETVQLCRAALRQPEFQSNIPVRVMAPEQFAMTFRPNLATQQSNRGAIVRQAKSESNTSRSIVRGIKKVFPLIR